MADASNDIPDLLRRLDTWLKKHRPRYATALGPGANAAQLSSLEAALKLPVPVPLRHLLTWHNGQRSGFVGGFEQGWLLMGSQSIADAKHNLDSDAAATGWQPSWIPFLDNDGGDYLCLDATKPECPVRAFFLGNKKHDAVAPSLASWLADFVTNVEKGNYVEEGERGAFLRRA